jgi:multiple sugar transport system permease protein
MAVVGPGGVDPAGLPTTAAAPPPPKMAWRRWDAITLLFLGPPALLLLVFLVYPTLYTIALSFNRGRRGEFTEWVGLQHYIGLFSDKAFINLGTFPPSGAIWNHLLWAVF